MMQRSGPWSGYWALEPADVFELWNLIGQIGFRPGYIGKVLWRGLPSDSFEVKSSIIRQLESEQIVVSEDEVAHRERQYLENARRWGIGITEYGRVPDLHLLSMLQHHGVPTRLIDVSYNPMTALWFACSDPRYLDEPGVLVSMTVSDSKIFWTTDLPHGQASSIGIVEQAQLRAALQYSEDHKQAVLVEPRVRDARMTVQEGLFLTSSVPSAPSDGPVQGFPAGPDMPVYVDALKLDPQDVDYPNTGPTGVQVMGIVLTPEVKSQMSLYLSRNFNRSTRTMYPDMSGYAAAVQSGQLTFGPAEPEPIPEGTCFPAQWLANFS
ncbi:blue (type1) copper domain-containing protein [Arthrobacter crystallopoietes BAB-32]|uniref:Blue (Type1) copper domain-containing protein n=1 Tax=Arthrobacter crystallopoietes BAB-32 TaxID=1246476 RepID=N1V3S8_9MICC|nr:FRG domain-containing protein [Arthrobacter crystallopoietes]EMY36010.1 blue (type1) copper domain-containing protein [Arthrobacter crystallopoietes BAB-32]